MKTFRNLFLYQIAKGWKEKLLSLGFMREKAPALLAVVFPIFNPRRNKTTRQINISPWHTQATPTTNKSAPVGDIFEWASEADEFRALVCGERNVMNGVEEYNTY